MTIEEDPTLFPEEPDTIVWEDGDELAVWSSEDRNMSKLINHPNFEFDERKSIIEGGIARAIFGTLPAEDIDDIRRD